MGPRDPRKENVGKSHSISSDDEGGEGEIIILLMQTKLALLQPLHIFPASLVPGEGMFPFLSLSRFVFLQICQPLSRRDCEFEVTTFFDTRKTVRQTILLSGKYSVFERERESREGVIRVEDSTF